MAKDCKNRVEARADLKKYDTFSEKLHNPLPKGAPESDEEKEEKRASLRKTLIFWYIVTYVTVWSVITVLALLKKWFVLSDGVMITLLSTTFATVVGMFMVIVRYYFPKH